MTKCWAIARQDLSNGREGMFTFEWERSTDIIKRSAFGGPVLGVPEEVAAQETGKAYFQRVHPDDRDRLLTLVHSLTPEHSTYRTIYRVFCPMGRVLTVEESGRARFDAQGQWVGLTGVAVDITQRRRLEEELEESRAVLQRQLTEIETIYRSAPIGLNVLDPDLRFVRINERLAEMNGFSVEEHLGRTVRELLPDLADPAERLLLPIFETGEPLLNVEIRGETPAQPGVPRIWLEHFLPLKEGDRVVGISTVCEEITERKRTEQMLAERVAQQAAIAHLGQQALVSDDLDQFLARVTAQVAKVLKVEYCKVLELLPDSKELLLRSGVGWQLGLVGQAVVGSDRTSQAGYTLLSQEPVIVENLATETRFSGPPLLTDHGVVSGMSTPIRGSEHQPFGVLGVHSRSQRRFTENDVNFLLAIANILSATIARHRTEQEIRQVNASLERRVEERTQQLVDANQELEAFAYSVSHDLRAPLRAIEGFARIFQEDYGDRLDETGKEYAQMLINSASRLDALIQDLLAYSRLGRRDVQLVPVSVAAVIDSAIETLDPALRQRQPQVSVVPLPSVLAQRNVLQQVLTNLIANAIKFVDPDQPPTIRIWAEERDPFIRLWIEDNGIGIAPVYQERIFRPFERLHGVEAYPGTGIGLAIVQRGIERMGGSVGVESDGKSGSQFWIELLKAPDPGTE
ncbi:MAG: ATP-binding protein [Synechococcales bacterium]|nr:ATP-binding protein [Synechococcales bacterium]